MKNPSRVVFFFGAAILAFVACSSSSPSTAPSPDGGTGIISPKKDSGTTPFVPDANGDEPVDTGAPDSYVPCIAEPVVLQPAFVPPAAPKNACTSPEIANFISACLQTGGATCTAFQTEYPSCYSCMLSPTDAPSRGPVVSYENGNFFFVNSGGCIALMTGDSSATGCGAADEEATDCATQSCSACPTATANEFTDFDNCRSLTGITCADEYTRENVACAAIDSDASADVSIKNFCEGTGTGDTFAILAMRVGLMFCNASSDGGTDGGTD